MFERRRKSLAFAARLESWLRALVQALECPGALLRFSLHSVLRREHMGSDCYLDHARIPILEEKRPRTSLQLGMHRLPLLLSTQLLVSQSKRYDLHLPRIIQTLSLIYYPLYNSLDRRPQNNHSLSEFGKLRDTL